MRRDAILSLLIILALSLAITRVARVGPSRPNRALSCARPHPARAAAAAVGARATQGKHRRGRAEACASEHRPSYCWGVIERDGKFRLGQVVRHRLHPFRGVVFDVDPTFSNTDEWWLSIPAEMRPRKDQPYYHLLAENEKTTYIAYVSEQNLLPDDTGKPCRHPQIDEVFGNLEGSRYELLAHVIH